MQEKRAEQFFDNYAVSFDSIYGENRNFAHRFLDQVFRKSMWLRFDYTIRGCAPLEGSTVLDIGCGPGLYSVELAERGAGKVVGIDPAPGMLDLARHRSRERGITDRCEFLCSRMEDYSPSGPFDYTIVMGVMDYVMEPRPFIERILRLTNRKAFFSFPESDGVLAAIRRYRYRKRTSLRLYRRNELIDFFEQIVPGKYKITPLARDFLVEADFTK